MKPLPLLLTLSLAGNLIGSAVLLARSQRETGAAQPSAASAAVSSTTRAKATAPRDSGASFWGRVASEDLEILARRLRASGMPRRLRDALLTGLIEERYHERLDRVRNGDASPNYWQRGGAMTPERLESYLALKRERDDLIRDVTGTDPRDSPVRLAVAQRVYGLADVAKVSALSVIDSDYESLLSAYRVNGFITKSDQAAVALIERERAADLAELLPPGELFEYQLRRSDAALQLKRELTYFKPTEEEYRQLFPLFQTFSAAYPAGNTFSFNQPKGSAESAARSDLVHALSDQLGPARAQELALALNPTNPINNAFVARVGLPLTTAGRLNDIQSTYSGLMSNMASARQQDPAAQQAVRDQATVTLREMETLLGADTLALYRDTVGTWVRGFDQLAAPPVAAPPGP